MQTINQLLFRYDIIMLNGKVLSCSQMSTC